MKNKIIYGLLSIVLIGLVVTLGNLFSLVMQQRDAIINLYEEIVKLKEDNIQRDRSIVGLLKKVKILEGEENRMGDSKEKLMLANSYSQTGNAEIISENGLDCYTDYYIGDADYWYELWKSGYKDSPVCAPGYTVTSCGGGCLTHHLSSIERQTSDIYNDRCRLYCVWKNAISENIFDVTVRCCKIK